jgi:hypothetical protein
VGGEGESGGRAWDLPTVNGASCRSLGSTNCQRCKLEEPGTGQQASTTTIKDGYTTIFVTADNSTLLISARWISLGPANRQRCKLQERGWDLPAGSP